MPAIAPIPAARVAPDDDVRSLVRRAQFALGARSLYALALSLGLKPRDVQRWHAHNRAPRVARLALSLAARVGH